MVEDVQRLEKILAEVHEHAGAVTLWQDKVWLMKVQREAPAWALPVFQKYAKVPQKVITSAR